MRTRRNSVGLWLSDAELTHLRQQCQITGLNTNTYLRKLIMGEHLCPRPPDAYAALLRELSAIGNNINQIAHWTNGKGYATQAEIHEAVSLVKQAYWRGLSSGSRSSDCGSAAYPCCCPRCRGSQGRTRSGSPTRER